MAYTNKVYAVAAILFIAVAIAPRLAESQTPMFPKMTPECATVLPDLLDKCFATVRDTPTEDCCNDLKSATSTQVTCLCDNYITKPEFVNITKPYADGITTKCGALDKFSCDGTTKGGEEKKEDGSSNSKSTKEGNEGKANKVAASMAVFGLLASLFFVMF